MHFEQLQPGLNVPPAAHVVVTEDGSTLAGVIQLADVEPFLRDPYVAETVLAIDVAHEKVPHLDAAMSLPQALEVFARNPEDTLPVVETAGERANLVGVLDREDLYLAVSEVTRRSRARAV